MQTHTLDFIMGMKMEGEGGLGWETKNKEGEQGQVGMDDKVENGQNQS